MGVDPKPKARKSVPAGKRLFDQAKVNDDGPTDDWTAMDAGRILEIIGLVTSRGGAIRFGYTRDGKACSVGVYLGEQRDTLYLRPNGDIEEIWTLIESTFEALPNTRGRAS